MILKSLLNGNIGLLSLFREFDNYIVNALTVAEINIGTYELESNLLIARDKGEIGDFEWREVSGELLSKILVRDQYIPQNRNKTPDFWHPDARFRLICALFSFYGIESGQMYLQMDK